MPRAGRSFDERRIYHIYNRVGGGWTAFADDELAGLYVALLRETMRRDETPVLARCLL